MKRALVDLSSVIWTCLRAGKDQEHGVEVLTEAGKPYWVNSDEHGYNNAINHLEGAIKELNLVPHQMIFVVEGQNSKAGRQALMSNYKAKGRDKVELEYENFNKVKARLLSLFLGLGAQSVSQAGVEADDVIGYLAEKLKGEVWIISNDKDLAQCVRGNVHLLRMGQRDPQPFGPFDPQYIATWIALVGDASDGIPGAAGFGQGAAEKMLIQYGQEGLEIMTNLIKNQELGRLAEDVADFKPFQKIIDSAGQVYLCYQLARLRTEHVNTLQRPLEWKAGLPVKEADCLERQFRRWAAKEILVSQENYEEARTLLRKHLYSSPWFALDIEGHTPAESDAWLAALSGDEESNEDLGVDTFGTELTGLSITFGDNMQYTVYLTHEHLPEPGVTQLTIEQVRDFVGEIPRSHITWVHNASYELPVLYNEWGEAWKDDELYHGFLRNVRDTSIASSYVDENEPRGLKKLSKRLMGYEQASFESVTLREMPPEEWVARGQRGRLISNDEGIVKAQLKMNGLKASEVLSYGCDDSLVTAHLANHFVTIMEIEDTFEVFEQVETWPAYLTAYGFVKGADFSLEEMAGMEKEDDAVYDQAWAKLRQYLIERGYNGTVCPSFESVDAPSIKEAYKIIFHDEFKTLVRTPSKLAMLLREKAETLGSEEVCDDLNRLASIIDANAVQELNTFVKSRFKAEPVLDLASPKQMRHFLYDTIGIPIAIVNEVTDTERTKVPGLADAMRRFRQKRMGKPSSLSEDDLKLLRSKAKTDDTAIDWALAFDADSLNDRDREALKCIGTMKKVMTRRGLFYKTYWRIKHWKDGKIHAQVNQCAAVTRRYSMSKPNLQQLPKKGEGIKFRGCFKPHHRDAVICSIDFSGQELRLAAERSQDKNLLACFVGENLMDMHALTGSGAMKLKWGADLVAQAWGRLGEGIDKGTELAEYHLLNRARALGKSESLGKLAADLRNQGKQVNFTAQFGGQALKVAETIIMKVEDASIFLEARAKRFPGLEEASKRAAAFAEKHGYAVTLMGARRHLRNSILSDNKAVSSGATRQAWNMEIQGSAGEMTKIGMARLWLSGALFKYDARFIAPVHDELVTSVHRDHAIDFIKAKHEAMTGQYASMKVPVLGSISVGPDFAQQIECSDDLRPDYDAARLRAAISDIFSGKESGEDSGKS